MMTQVLERNRKDDSHNGRLVQKHLLQKLWKILRSIYVLLDGVKVNFYCNMVVQLTRVFVLNELIR